jgi:UDP-GlcNAc:undecaprenyl-phosphate/decaprenyl-phosphate GlcNAc-1-phosphate transferase
MSHTLWFVLPGLVAAALAFALTPLVARLAVILGAVDMPGERKVHTTPIPRLGGLAVVAAIVVTFAAARFLSRGHWQLPPQLVLGMASGILPILAISVIDDIRGVAARWKFIAHVLGAFLAVSQGITLAPVVHLFGSPLYIGWIAAPLSVAWIVGVTNAFNIIDGLDGLSAGLAFISAICMSAVFALVGQPEMAGVSLVLGGALAGFLPYNIHPARLFLGDTGATAIGFCLASFALRGGSTLSSGFAALLPVFILGLPLADTLIAMLRRTLHRLEYRRGSWFEADRNHIHHRLLALGVDHAKAVLWLYGAGLVLAGAALLSVFLTTREAAMMVTALVLAGVVGIQRLGYDEFAFIRRGTVLRVYEIPAVKRGFFIVLVDIALSFGAAYLSIGLKTDTWAFTAVRGYVLELATTLAPVTVVVFAWRRMYKGSWRVAGLYDFAKAAVAVSLATVIGALMLRTYSPTPYAVSLFAIYGLVALLLTVALRASYIILEASGQRSSHEGVPILIYGAGRRGVAAAQELFQNHGAGLRPVGFVDDDPDKRGRIMNGVPVLGPGRDLERLLRTSGARGLMVSTSTIVSTRLARCVELCDSLSIGVFRLDVSVRHLDGATYVAPMPLTVATSAQPVADREIDIDLRVGRQICPSCKRGVAFRSKARNAFERFRKVRTQKRIYRCEQCGWRGWLMPLDFTPEPMPLPSAGPDFDLLDIAIQPPAAKPVPISLEALDLK